jgi:hypothetical protein
MEYTYSSHLYLVIVGILLLIILLFSLRSEIVFLHQHRKYKLQFYLSLMSIFVMLLLTMLTIFHWFISPIFEFTAILILFPLLLIIAPLILWLRAKAFAGFAKDRMEEQRKLIMEIQDLIDEKKRQKIKDAKLARGEQVDKDDLSQD